MTYPRTRLPIATSALFVLTIGALEMLVFALWRGGVDWSVLRANLWLFVVIGLLVAASTNLNYVAVAYIDPGTAALPGKTSILIGLGLSLAWLRERLSRIEVVGAVIAILGVFIITFQPVEVLRLGSLLVLTSALMYELHTALVKRFAGDMEFTHFFLFRLLLTASFLFTAYSGAGRPAMAAPAGLARTPIGRHG